MHKFITIRHTQFKYGSTNSKTDLCLTKHPISKQYPGKLNFHINTSLLSIKNCTKISINLFAINFVI